MVAPLLIANFPRVVGGGEISLLELAGELKKRGHEPLLAIPEGGDWKTGFEQVEIPASSFKAAAALRRISAGRDLIHATGARGLAAAWLARTGKPLVWHARVADRDKLDYALKMMPDAIIANSMATASRFGNSEKVVVIPNGVRKPVEPIVTLKLDPHKKHVAVIARMTPEKGHLDLLPAIESILSSRSDIAFSLAGDSAGEIGDAYRELRAKFGDDRILMPGYVDSIANHIREFDLVVVPSRVEGFGRVAVESMLSGVVPLCRKIGGLAEMCEGMDGLFLPDDPSQWASKILASLEKIPYAREALISRGERYSVEKHAEAVIELYQSLLLDR